MKRRLTEPVLEPITVRRSSWLGNVWVVWGEGEALVSCFQNLPTTSARLCFTCDRDLRCRVITLTTDSDEKRQMEAANAAVAGQLSSKDAEVCHLRSRRLPTSLVAT